MSGYQLAQLNIGIIKGPMDSPIMAEFAANLDRINALAESAPGYVWRLQTEEGDATALRPLGDNVLVNMSVWDDVAALNRYVYKTAHVEVMRRRKEWFERMAEAYLALWWVPGGHRPSIEEALQRLETLRSLGPTPRAKSHRVREWCMPSQPNPDRQCLAFSAQRAEGCTFSDLRCVERE